MSCGVNLWPKVVMREKMAGDKMNWDAIGAIGEAIGAATVVITLAYLAV